MFLTVYEQLERLFNSSSAGRQDHLAPRAVRLRSLQLGRRSVPSPNTTYCCSGRCCNRHFLSPLFLYELPRGLHRSFYPVDIQSGTPSVLADSSCLLVERYKLCGHKTTTKRDLFFRTESRSEYNKGAHVCILGALSQLASYV